jgi:hypothetical protein
MLADRAQEKRQRPGVVARPYPPLAGAGAVDKLT